MPRAQVPVLPHLSQAPPLSLPDEGVLCAPSIPPPPPASFPQFPSKEHARKSSAATAWELGSRLQGCRVWQAGGGTRLS